MSTENNAQAIIDYVRDNSGVNVIDVEVPGTDDTIPVGAVPAGFNLHNLKTMIDQWRPFPERRIGTARLTDEASFIDHVKRFATKDEAVIFVCRQTPAVTAIYNYHTPAKDPDSTSIESVALEGARHCDHRAAYTFPVSDEWRRWVIDQGTDEWMSQEEFAEFIEDHMADLHDPMALDEATRAMFQDMDLKLASPGAVFAMSRGLSAAVNCVIKSHQNLGSGEAQVVFTEEHKDETGAALRLPGAFVVRIPVFDGAGADLFPVPIRIRYRLGRGTPTKWRLIPHRPDVFFDQAVGSVVSGIREQLPDVPLFYGSP